MDDPTHRDSKVQAPVPGAGVVPTEYWLSCDCPRCEISREIFTRLVKSAVRDALAENEDQDG